MVYYIHRRKAPTPSAIQRTEVHTMNAIILNAASIEAIRTFTDVSIEATGAKESAAAALISQGVTADMLKAPAKGESRELYDGIKVAIVSGFSEEARTLLLAKISELTEEQIYVRKFKTSSTEIVLKVR